MIEGVDGKLLVAILSVLIFVFAGYLPYFRDIFRNKTQPHAYTWLIWAITQGTATVALWHGKGGWGVLPLLVGTMLVFTVFLLSLKYGTKNITRADTIILIAALLAIVIWWQLHNPLLAVVMVTLIDVAGYAPSLRKTFEEPWSETPLLMGNICSDEYSPDGRTCRVQFPHIVLPKRPRMRKHCTAVNVRFQKEGSSQTIDVVTFEQHLNTTVFQSA